MGEQHFDDAWSNLFRTRFLLTSCATASFVVEAPTRFRCLSNNLDGFWPLSAASLCTHNFYRATPLEQGLCTIRAMCDALGGQLGGLYNCMPDHHHKDSFFVVWTMSGQAAKKNNGEEQKMAGQFSKNCTAPKRAHHFRGSGGPL